jgi:hypothetical protein
MEQLLGRSSIGEPTKVGFAIVAEGLSPVGGATMATKRGRENVVAEARPPEIPRETRGVL